MWLSVSPSFTWYCPQPGDPAVITPAVSSGTAIPVSTRTTLPIPSISQCDCHLTVSAGADVTKGADGVLVAPDMQCSQFNAELHECSSQTAARNHCSEQLICYRAARPSSGDEGFAAW